MGYLDGLFSDGIPERYREASVADFENPTPQWFETNLDQIKRDGLFLWGDAGTGKTHLGTAIYRQLLPGDPTLRTRWITVPLLLYDLRKTMGSHEWNEQTVIEYYSKAYLVLLDDLGAEKVSDWTGQAVYLILSERINSVRPTIVTSNLDLNAIDKYDPRLASRLGGMVCQKMHGKDRRLS